MPSVYNCRKGATPEPPAGAVYVGRPTMWGNPFSIGEDGTRQEVVAKYRDWLLNGAGQTIAHRARRELRGKDLVCWCAPKPCHAYVLLEVASSRET
jgi:hypothetical protein